MAFLVSKYFRNGYISKSEFDPTANTVFLLLESNPILKKNEVSQIEITAIVHGLLYLRMEWIQFKGSESFQNVFASLVNKSLL